MPAGQLSVRTMASCYNCCAHSRVHITFRTCFDSAVAAVAVELVDLGRPFDFKMTSVVTRQVQARNAVQVGDGWGHVSPTVSHVTQDGVPSAPLNVVRKSRSDSCITISWQPPSTPNGVVISYKVCR